VIDAMRRLQAERPTVIVSDAKHPERFRDVGVTAVTPNFAEAARLLGLGDVGDRRVEAVIGRADLLRALSGAELTVVTLDAEGAILLERDREPYRTYARPAASSSSTAGAGDTFTAAFATALGAGADAVTAVELASAAAAVVVESDGTTTCSSRQLARRLVSADRVVRDPATAAALADAYRDEGRSIVFTNGVFDILHRGHVTYLNQAKALGDVLIVGLNSDASVRRLKGPERPINTMEDRAQVLAALSCVDHIVPFEQDTPVALIERLCPDVYVKGGDYTEAMLPEREVVRRTGGRLEILGYVQDTSTTGIIEQIRSAS
jgi:D-beta-D-heptose 7-phosphate kinase/D-beta-D-heptose 1-phosphate adenosyltransferase